jgi:hypothetical protein
MATVTLGTNGPGGTAFRLVLPSSKRDRLNELAAAFCEPCSCSVVDCGREGMPVLLVESELEAILCPVHQLVLRDGSPVEGEPVVVTAAW